MVLLVRVQPISYIASTLLKIPYVSYTGKKLSNTIIVLSVFTSSLQSYSDIYNYAVHFVGCYYNTDRNVIVCFLSSFGDGNIIASGRYV